MVMTTAVLCLALNAYHESRSEPVAGQIAVTQVALNRAGRDPKKVCAEVVKPRQFSWTKGRIRLHDGVYRVTKRGLPTDKKAWVQALAVTKLVLSGMSQDLTRGATFYHERSISPKWNRGLIVVATYGAHVFYKSV